MPLIPRDPETVRLDIGEDWYELRGQLGWYHRQRLSEVSAMAVHLPWRSVKDGDIQVPQDEKVPVTLDGLPDVNLGKLLAYVKTWSHKEPINEHTVKRLPPAHARALLRRIDELEERQDGPADDSPLGE